MSWLKGYRTYLAAAGFAALALAAGLDGDWARAIQDLLTGLGLFGLRAALPRAALGPAKRGK
jgi:predicted RNA methylase